MSTGNPATEPTEPADRPVGRAPQPPAPEAPAPAEPARSSQPVPPAQQPTRPAASTTPDPGPEVETRAGRTAGVWIALILGAIVLVALLIFVIQNNVSAQFQYFGAEFSLPLGVAMLLAAIAGALVMALVGSVRMIQMSLTIRKQRKTLAKVQRVTH